MVSRYLKAILKKLGIDISWAFELTKNYLKTAIQGNSLIQVVFESEFTGQSTTNH